MKPQSSPMIKSQHFALVAVGSNVTSYDSTPRQTLEKLVNRMGDESLKLIKVSRFFATPAFPKGNGPDFVNAALSVQTTMTPIQLMKYLHRIETELGRERKERWAARVLDLDLITYDDLVLPDHETQKRWMDLDLDMQQTDTPVELILPHPRVQDRSFVLQPLHDIAPDWTHPVLGQTVSQMLAARPSHERAEIKPLEA